MRVSWVSVWGVLIYFGISSFSISAALGLGVFPTPIVCTESGCGGMVCNGECIPIALDWHVEIIDTVYVGSNLAYLICARIHAQGYKTEPSNSFIRAKIRATNSAYPVVSCSNSPNTAGAECLECDSTAIYTLWCDPGDSVGFYVISENVEPLFYSCACTTATIWLTCQLPDTNSSPPQIAETAPDYCRSQLADPISMSSGNMYAEYTDAEFQTDLGLPLRFARSYNSGGGWYGSLGHHWKHSFDFTLSVDDSTGDVTLHEPTGRDLLFRCYRYRYPSGGQWVWDTTYLPIWGIHSTLIYDAANGIYSLTGDDDIVYVFNDDNQLDYVLDRNDNAINLHYSGGVLDFIHDDQGDSLYLEYNNSLLARTYDHTGTIASYGYDVNGQLKSVSYPNGDTLFYSYVDRGPAEHLLSEILDSDGKAQYYDYDTLGRAITTYSDQENGRYDITYTNICTTCPQGMEAEAVSASENSSVYHSMWGPGHNRRFVYDIADPECNGCGEQFAYDADGNIARTTYKNGAVDSFSYDDRGNMTMRIRGLGTPGERTTWIDYSPVYNLPIETRTPSLFGGERMDVTDYFRDANGNLDSLVETGWVGSDNQYRDVTAFTYNSYGQVTKMDGPRTDVGDTILFKYNDDTKYLDSIQRPNGDFTEFGQRDRFGRPLWVKDGNGIVTRYVYDNRGRIEKVIEHSGSDSAMTQYTYDCSGNITRVRFPAGNYLNYTYDNSNRLVGVSNSVNDHIIYEYDDMNNLERMEIKDSSGTVHRYEEYDYDAKNRLTHIYNPDMTYTQFDYDSLDNIIWRRDALGNYIYYRYDTLNRLDTIVYMNDGNSIITAIAYNNRDQITEIIDPDSNIYSYTYDDRGNLTSDECAATGLTQYFYDGAGNVTHVMTALSEDIYYDYDALNRLEEIRFPDSTENISYEYDETRAANGMGYLYKENTPACTTKYLYDAFGRITSATQTVDTFRYVIAYQYTKNGDISQMITPSNLYLNYYYDAAQRPMRVSRGTDSGNVPVIDSILYAPFGGPTSYVHGNGIKTHISYTSRYLIDNIHTTTGASVMNRTYFYDAVGNVQSFVDSLDDSYSQSLYYDDMGRLTKAVSGSFPSDSVKYTYYDNGNRHEKIIGGDITTYMYADNRLIALSGADTVNFGYDDLGNVIADTLDTLVHNYTYNYAGRLSAVGPGTLARYYYNGSGQRIKKVAGNVNRVYNYDQWGNLICETDTSRAWKADYVYINGWPVAKIIKYAESEPDKGGGGGGSGLLMRDPYYYHNDHLGTPQALTHSGGTLIWWKGYYYPFGTLYDETAVIDNNLRFPGQYADEENDLYYNWHRYYSPDLGRYYNPEPIIFYRATYAYQYVMNDPIMHIDPTGLKRSAWQKAWSEQNRVLNERLTAMNIVFKWSSGLGAADVTYGTESAASRTLANSSIIQKAIKRFEAGQFTQGQKIDQAGETMWESLFNKGRAILDGWLPAVVGSLDEVWIAKWNENCYVVTAVNYTNMPSFLRFLGYAGKGLTGREEGEFLPRTYQRSEFPLGGEIRQVYNILVRVR